MQAGSLVHHSGAYRKLNATWAKIQIPLAPELDSARVGVTLPDRC
jgi:hypothetical protein